LSIIINRIQLYELYFILYFVTRTNQSHNVARKWVSALDCQKMVDWWEGLFSAKGIVAGENEPLFKTTRNYSHGMINGAHCPFCDLSPRSKYQVITLMSVTLPSFCARDLFLFSFDWLTSINTFGSKIVIFDLCFHLTLIFIDPSMHIFIITSRIFAFISNIKKLFTLIKKSWLFVFNYINFNQKLFFS